MPEQTAVHRPVAALTVDGVRVAFGIASGRTVACWASSSAVATGIRRGLGEVLVGELASPRRHRDEGGHAGIRPVCLVRLANAGARARSTAATACRAQSADALLGALEQAWDDGAARAA